MSFDKICLEIFVTLALLSPLQAVASVNLPPQANSPQLTSVDDLKTKRIGVLQGSAHESYALKHYPDAQVLQFKSPADVLLAVKTNKVDAALYDAEPLRGIFRQDNSYALLGDPLFSFDVGVGFNKQNRELKDRFDAFLRDIKASGVYKDMVVRWMIKGETTMPPRSPANKNGFLVVGVSDAGLPFTVVKDNQLVGFDIELVERFAASEEKEIRFANMDFGSLIAAVSSGKADMIASAIYITDERKKEIEFSHSYYEMATRVFGLAHNIASGELPQAPSNLLRTLDDLSDKKIGVMLGSTHDVFAHKHYPQADILQYKSPSDVLLAVKTHRVDAALYNSVSLVEVLKQSPELGVIGEPFEMMPVAFGFSKQNVELWRTFNEFLQSIKANGLYDDMITRWTKKDDVVMPMIETPNKNGILIAGHLSDGGLPFATIKDNQNIGLNIELAKRFAAYVGKDIRFDDMEFGSLIPAVSTGKIDFIAVTLMITEERKQKINFSDPYYQIGMSAFALKKNIATTAATEEHRSGSSLIEDVVKSFDSNIMQEKRYLLLWDGLKTTILISVLSAIFGTLAGGMICFMRMSKSRLLNVPAKIYIDILRGTPVLVVLMIMFYVVFGSVNINPIVVATIAFGMNFGSYAAEIFRSGIEGIEKGQLEAGLAMGFNKLKTFQYIVLPQTIRRILPVYKGEFISLVKMTSIVGYIAVQDLTKASDIIRSRTFDAFFPLITIAIFYFAISWMLMQMLEYVELVTDPKNKRRSVRLA
jgi:polar amino acid transport system substrate-binding protein